jgi:hypothetical protein
MMHLEIFPGFSNKKQSACGLLKTKKLFITLPSRIQGRLIPHAVEKNYLSFFFLELAYVFASIQI